MTTSLHCRSYHKAALSPHAALISLTLLLPNISYAHTGIVLTNGLSNGLLHPFIGLDHLCAMVAVGLWATQMGGRAIWFVPLTFVSVMTLGGLFGMNGIQLPFIENGILMSLLVLGALIAAAIRLPLLASTTIIAMFALFHGHSHGAEMPQTVSGLSYALGFMLATTTLHLSGIALATGLNKINRPQLLRWLGASIALFGGALFFAG